MTTVTSLKMILFGKVREGLRRTSPSCQSWCARIEGWPASIGSVKCQNGAVHVSINIPAYVGINIATYVGANMARCFN